jgi:thymidylate synthase ThyX
VVVGRSADVGQRTLTTKLGTQRARGRSCLAQFVLAAACMRRILMTANLRQLGYEDRTRINVNEDWERRYWMTQLHCSEKQLRDAVRVVGSSVDAVRAYLQQQSN